MIWYDTYGWLKLYIWYYIWVDFNRLEFVFVPNAQGNKIEIEQKYDKKYRILLDTLYWTTYI